MMNKRICNINDLFCFLVVSYYDEQMSLQQSLNIPVPLRHPPEPRDFSFPVPLRRSAVGGVTSFHVFRPNPKLALEMDGSDELPSVDPPWPAPDPPRPRHSKAARLV